MKNSFNHLLIVLACFDNLFLVFCVMDYSIAGVFQWYKTADGSRRSSLLCCRPFSETGEFYAMIFPKFLYPVNHITLRSTLQSNLVITFINYFNDCHL